MEPEINLVNCGLLVQCIIWLNYGSKYKDQLKEVWFYIEHEYEAWFYSVMSMISTITRVSDTYTWKTLIPSYLEINWFCYKRRVGKCVDKNYKPTTNAILYWFFYWNILVVQWFTLWNTNLEVPGLNTIQGTRSFSVLYHIEMNWYETESLACIGTIHWTHKKPRGLFVKELGSST
jgi:hypothetical protein